VDAVGWRVDEWFSRSVLLPHDALDEVVAGLSVYGRTFDFGWDHDDRFFFGDVHEISGVAVRPWAHSMRNPVSEEVVVDLRRDFRWYHALEEREPGRFWHPVDGVLVATTGVEHHEFYNSTPRVRVHRQYLRDFLAARGWMLVVVQVADRFANVDEESELGQPTGDEVDLGGGATLRTTVQPLGHGLEGFRGRGTLWRNLSVHPHTEPRYSASPWPYFGRRDDEGEPADSFIVNADGDRGSLSAPDCPTYLYFHRAVLERYLSDPTLRVFFHMRTWGVASGPGNAGSVDVGINESGLITAFTPDLRDLPPPLQQHWASFSRLPSGGVCKEMFQTRMQQRPPHSPSLVEIVQTGLDTLNAKFRECFSSDLLVTTEPPAMAGHLTVGPITESPDEFVQLCKVLFRWVVEGMSVSALRGALGEGNYEPEWRQIKLLSELLSPDAELPAVFRGLNEFRIADAHVTSADVETALTRIGVGFRADLRERWLAIVDRLATVMSDEAATLCGEEPKT